MSEPVSKKQNVGKEKVVLAVRNIDLKKKKLPPLTVLHSSTPAA